MTKHPRKAMWLSFACGFASLSIEILWVRLYGFAHRSTPAGFGFVLAAYLLGIALGAYVGSGACKRLAGQQLWQRSAQALLLSSVATLTLPLLFGWTIRRQFDSVLSDMVMIAISSALLAYVFPIAHHLGADAHRGDRQGRRFASVYMANVMGAALGPLVTGYVLLETLTLQQCFAVLSGLQAVIGAVLLASVSSSHRRALQTCIAGLVGLGALALLILGKPHALIDSVSKASGPLRTVVENRHGIVTIAEGEGSDDIVYGGNVYDGRTNIDLLRNTNGIHRVALLSALQPKPRRVLMVGLSIGSWLALARNFPGVEQIDVIEINPGYLDAVGSYQPQADALSDPRVRIHIDDARRWLRANPHNRYDLVIMNTTWHWRANSTLLLSRESLQLIKKHMDQGAVMAFNTTSSPDAFHTATDVFAHAYRFGNFVYGADFDFRARKDAVGPEHFLRASGRQSEPPTATQRQRVEQLFRTRFVTIDEVRALAGRPLETVTDLNMITEFKHGKAEY
ncbi:hypothetical protein [Xenophilus sp.]|uniref:spermine/spermidine synthase domain-containing protein n=1 Tax=Xenophilus sp. TaxID=1873499 RepID=UPI0037DC92FD